MLQPHNLAFSTRVVRFVSSINPLAERSLSRHLSVESRQSNADLVDRGQPGPFGRIHLSLSRNCFFYNAHTQIFNVAHSYSSRDHEDREAMQEAFSLSESLFREVGRYLPVNARMRGTTDKIRKPNPDDFENDLKYLAADARRPIERTERGRKRSRPTRLLKSKASEL